MNIIVITGWGLGHHVLKPFVDLLEAEGHKVDLWDIFDPFHPKILAEKISRAEYSQLLIGWSLGGQLALYLAHTLQTQREIDLPVICCMSNPSFVAQAAWFEAMPQVQYQQFSKLMNSNPLKGLQRFCHLVTMGSEEPLKRAKTLQNNLSYIDLNYQKKHLYLLEQLDLREMLKNHPSKILFLFSEQDQLVPCKVAEKVKYIAEDRIEIQILKGTHDRILFEPKLILARISNFLEMSISGEFEAF